MESEDRLQGGQTSSMFDAVQTWRLYTSGMPESARRNLQKTADKTLRRSLKTRPVINHRNNSGGGPYQPGIDQYGIAVRLVDTLDSTARRSIMNEWVPRLAYALGTGNDPEDNNTCTPRFSDEALYSPTTPELHAYVCRKVRPLSLSARGWMCMMEGETAAVQHGTVLRS